MKKILVFLLILIPITVFASEIVNISRNASLSNGLVGMWSFDGGDVTSSTAYDRSGNSNDGTLNNTNVIQGAIGQALNFNGSNSYINAGNSGTLQLSTGTVSAWVNTTSLGSAAGAPSFGYSAIVAKQYAYSLFVLNGNLVVYDWTASAVRDTGVFVADGRWHHVLMSFDSGVSNGLKIYIDGTLQLTSILTINSQASNLEIGENSGNNQWFNGIIDDVRVYNRILIASEVTRLSTWRSSRMNISKNTQNTSGLLGVWSFDGPDVTSTTAYDRSGQNRTGTLNNFSGTTSASIGIFGQALTFNGINSTVTFSDTGLPSGSSDRTMSFWERTTLAGSERYAFSYGAGGGGQNLLVGIYPSFGGTCVNCAVVTNNGQALFGVTPINDGKWHLITLTTTGNTGILYVDGVSESSGAISINTVLTGTGYIGNALALGGYYWDGGIDDVRIYNRVLSPTEILSMYRWSSNNQTNTSRNSQLTSGLAGLWSFDGADLTSTTASDRSGKGNNGTLTNMVGTTSARLGIIGQALTFDGTNDYIDAGNAASLQLSTGTVSAWINTSNSPGDGVNGYSGIVAKVFAYGMFLKNNVFTIYDWGVNGAESTGVNLADGKWHHVLFTFNSGVSNTMNAYVDGVLQLTSTVTISNQTTALRIGAETVGGQYFTGKIDEARVYNRILTTAEITRLYNMGRQDK